MVGGKVTASPACEMTQAVPRKTFGRWPMRPTGLSMALSFDPAEDVTAPMIVLGARPKDRSALSRTSDPQAGWHPLFERAGFAPYDVHIRISDWPQAPVRFSEPGCLRWFSYGDVLGAGAKR